MPRETHSTYTLIGLITGMQGEPLEGLTVYAYDPDPMIRDNLFGQAERTDADGRYTIEFHSEPFRSGSLESRGPDVFIRVFDGDEQLGESPVERNSERQITINLQVNYARTDPNEPARRVYGTVRDADDNVLPGITVKAFEKYMRSEEPFGEPVLTNLSGYYEIRDTKAFRRDRKGSAYLVVKAFAADDSLLATSSARSNIPESAERNLTILAEALLPPTLFEKIGRTVVAPLDGLKLEELEENKEHQDLSFLAGETGFEKNVLARFVMAHKLVQQGIQAEFWFVLLAGSFYEYAENQSLQEQLTTVLDTLPSLDATTVRKALVRGFNEKEIPVNLRENTDAWIEAFLGLVARRSVSESDNPTFVKLALDHARIEGTEKQEKFARLFNEYRALTPELLDVLKQDESFNNDEIADVRTSFRLAELTNGDFSVAKMLKDEFDIRQPENVRALAKKSEREWVNLMQAKYAAGDIKLPIEISETGGEVLSPDMEVYGKALERQFREAFPTAAFVGGLERALENGGTRGLHHAEALGRFLDSHENFEFLNTPVDAFLDNNTHPEFMALAQDENFRLEANAVGRMFKLNPNFEATDTLLADDLHSAQKIYRMGESEFVQRYADSPGFTAETAHIAWNRAADTYATVLTVVGDLLAFENETQPAALKFGEDALSSFPNWNNLFKTGDLCDCEHCRSVLGPAAYFADLLMFLRDRDADNDPVTKTSVKDVLFNRRPDLGFLELNCDNGQTLLPYIDVVCEVLEEVVAAGENDLELDFMFMPADLVVAKKAVSDSFFKYGISLGADFSLSKVNPNLEGRWVAHGDDVTYLLKGVRGSNFFAEILRNTKASAAELRAYPQYVNAKAYERLRAAKYPMTLPFDLYAEEVRVALQKINIKRWELMDTFRGTNQPNNPGDIEIACEYFGISTGASAPHEQSLILVPMPTDNEQQVIWGETGADWLITVGNVKTFLQKTGLEYNELLTLLDLKFIKLAGKIEINHSEDPACDTDKKTLQNLDAPKLDLIHRFLRMWRKLKGWKLWELDLVICQGSIGNEALNEGFLINLFYFSKLKDRLGGKTTVEQICSLFGNLNTQTRFTKSHEKREDALYQSLFLNRRLINPLDPAFDVDPVTNDVRIVIDPATGLPKPHKVVDHHPVILAALGIREADLSVLKELTQAPGMDILKLESLSFFWRHAWLSRLLKFKVEDWKALLKTFDGGISQFASPRMTLEFLERIDSLKDSGFTADELNWLLTADRSAKAATKEADAARFLLGLRKELQAIQAEHNPARYDFLTVTPPTDSDSLTTLLTSLLQKLDRSDVAADVFVKTLRGSVLLEASAQGMAVGFAFPPGITDTIPIQHVTQETKQLFRFAGLMTDAQRTTLLDDVSPALAALYESGELEASVPDLSPLPATFLAFPVEITGTGAPNHNIPIRYEMQSNQFRFTGLMTGTQQKILLSDVSLTDVKENPAYRSAIEELYQQSLQVMNIYRSAIEELYHQSLTAGTTYGLTEVKVVLPGGVALPADRHSTPIRYDDKTKTLSFTGVMTTAEQTELKAILTTTDGSAAIDELFQLPRLAVKFYKSVFTAPLEVLPLEVDFKAQLPLNLSNKISYDAEQQLLRLTGILSNDEKAALDALVLPVVPPLASEIAYHSAVNSLATQPQNSVPPDEGFWLTSNDLDITQAANDTFARRLANAATKALHYLSNTYTSNVVLEQCGIQLGLTEALTRRLLSRYTTLPDTLLTHLTGAFAATTDVVNYATLRLTFDGWFWASRVAAIWKKWKITPGELDKLIALTADANRAQLLDFGTLPLKGGGTIASSEKFLRTSRLLKIRDSLPEGEITLLEVLEKLNSGAYPAAFEVSAKGLPQNYRFPRTIISRPNNIPIQHEMQPTKQILRFTGLMTDSQRKTLLTHPSLGDVTDSAIYRQAIEKLFKSPFAADVERLNENWLAADVEVLITSLNMTYPADYLLAENWERLSRAFSFLNNLNASASTVEMFAAPEMTDVHTRTIKELLRSKLGAETWLALSVEIQDALRERKRDALAAFLLAQPTPDDAPSGKWENTNDLYAYYLLDVEMSSCQLTSRLVLGSGSIQLFVQRCFMGLEPGVVVQADGANGDSAWRWWKWMRKYRVWEANRKVYLWPENWIEPELKKDRSPFFKDMENELLQNEINQFTAETAFANYLEKLDGVAQLEIAGFYQEDDGDNTIIHVFGRTASAEPHLYYYRRYDYRQWTPWEKVDLDIQGDYLIPAVVNKRLFLFWPVFTEIPDEAGNSRMTVPTLGQRRFTPDKTTKRLRLQMAVSDYRQGKWTPKKVSTDFNESDAYNIEIVRQHYRFFFVDNSNMDGRIGIQYEGYSVGSKAAATKTKQDLVNTADETRIYRNTIASPAKTAADIVLTDAKAAVAAMKIPVDLAKWLLVAANDSVATCDDLVKTAGAVYNITSIARGINGDAYNFAVTAKTAVVKAAGPDADATIDATNFISALLTLAQAFDKINISTNDPDPAKRDKPVVGPLTRAAQKNATAAVEAGSEVLRTTIAFKDDAARTAKTANEEYKKAVALASEAENANNNFKFDYTAQASLGGVFDISGCTGVPEKARFLRGLPSAIFPEAASVGTNTKFLKWIELGGEPNGFGPQESRLDQDDDFTLIKDLPPTSLATMGNGILPTPVLRKTPGIFKISPAWHLSYFDKLWFDGKVGVLLPFFYNDNQRTFFVPSCIWSSNVYELSNIFGNAICDYPDIKKAVRKSEGVPQSDMRTLLNKLMTYQWFRFKSFYHPFVCDFARLINNPLKGIPALMSRETQLMNSGFSFDQTYDPTESVLGELVEAYNPTEQVDFTPDGAYSPYNWELFFHAPLLIANSLSKNQRFEEAREWYHFIFNPIGVESTAPGGSPMSKYWITKPFFVTTHSQYVQQRIDNMMQMLAGDTSVLGYSTQAKKDLADQVNDWRTNPFEPHRIANYRTVAYQKTVVMKYLDNLIAWGDNLFRQDSMESINEATQLYILAAEILGQRPKAIPPRAKTPVESFNELEYEFDRLSNALVQVENLVPVLPGTAPGGANQAPLPNLLYFCIPQNDKMLGYWDTVADRLYKIRHCMNIDGTVRQLALFEPAIDPGALVKAVAGGIDINAALADLNAPVPLYRFNLLLQKANEVCNDVKALGGALLAALEKKDAEALGQLRQSQEIRLLEAVKDVREKQIAEAKENLDGLKKSKVVMEIRRDYYRDIEKISTNEELHLSKLAEAHDAQQQAQGTAIAASIAHIIPTFSGGIAGGGGTPTVSMSIGGSNLGSALQAFSATFTFDSNAKAFAGNRASIIAGHERRWEDWKLQESLADKELEQIDKQIASADLRIAIAEKELDNHVFQIENAKATDVFMRTKYTNEELYQWQVGQISGVYFQSYKLAYDLAKQAERCFRFEVGLQDSSYINFGYWDSLKKGLLSGEKLQYDLRRLETAYLEQNRREFELTKHISLTMLDPLALVKLRETGRCFFQLPEEIFDLDYPGHYFRRIKSVSLTLPCVVGPYTTISCTLRLLKNSIRINSSTLNGYPHTPDDDDRFIENNIAVKAIAASSAQNDSGMFELSFRDERYLPFEGAGAVSGWSLELFNDLPSNDPDLGRSLRQFDYNTISDAILHVKYTAREDAGKFKNEAVTHLRKYFKGDNEGATDALRMFSLRQEFPTQWHRFLNPTNTENGNVFELEMSPKLFSLRDADKNLKVNSIWLLARCTNAGIYSVVLNPPLLPSPDEADAFSLVPLKQYGGLHFSQKDVSIEIVPTDLPVKWQLKMSRPSGGNLQEDPIKKVIEVEDIFLVLGYDWE